MDEYKNPTIEELRSQYEVQSCFTAYVVGLFGEEIDRLKEELDNAEMAAGINLYEFEKLQAEAEQLKYKAYGCEICVNNEIVLNESGRFYPDCKIDGCANGDGFYSVHYEEFIGLFKGSEFETKETECEYCKNNKSLYFDKENTNPNLREVYIELDGTLSITPYYGDILIDSVQIKINYCPMCGRKI